jgi:hypothetical protein
MPIRDTRKRTGCVDDLFPPSRRAEQNVAFLIGKAGTGARFDPAELTLDYCAQTLPHADN